MQSVLSMFRNIVGFTEQPVGPERDEFTREIAGLAAENPGSVYSEPVGHGLWASRDSASLPPPEEEFPIGINLHPAFIPPYAGTLSARRAWGKEEKRRRKGRDATRLPGAVEEEEEVAVDHEAPIYPVSEFLNHDRLVIKI